ncbi:MAG: hypothetical protein WBD31_31575 [Rubripirellula sp.]
MRSIFQADRDRRSSAERGSSSGGSKLVQLRIRVPGGETLIKSLQLQPAAGKNVTLTQ